MRSFLPRDPGRTGDELQSRLSRGAALDTAAPTVVHLQLCNWVAVLLTFVSTVVRQNFNASAAANVQRIAHESIGFPSRYRRNSPEAVLPALFCLFCGLARHVL